MFKKKSKSGTNRMIRKKEESSEEENIAPTPNSNVTTSPTVILAPLAQKVIVEHLDDKNERLTNPLPKIPVFMSRKNRASTAKSSMFSSNKPKYLTKVALDREYENERSTDGLESLERTDVVVTGDDLRKMIKGKGSQMDSSSDDPETKATIALAKQIRKQNELNEQKEEFIEVPKTTSLRAALRKRNDVTSSDSNDHPEERLPSYIASYEDEVATTGYASNPNQFKANHTSTKKKHFKHEYSLLREDSLTPNPDQMTNPSALWETDVLSASSSDEEAKWEQSLLRRVATTPIVSSLSSLASYNQPSTYDSTTTFSISSQEHVMNRLTSALNDMEICHNEDIRVITHTEIELESIEKEEEEEYTEKKDMEFRYDYYQRQCDFFRRLSGYLTDRQHDIEKIYQQICMVRKQYKANNDIVNSRYINDDYTYLTELGCLITIAGERPYLPEIVDIRSLTGPFFKSEIYYDIQMTQTRNRDRLIYIDGDSGFIQKTVREDEEGNRVITASPEDYLNNVIYHGYDDDSAALYVKLLNEFREKIDDIFDSSAYTHMRFDRILAHFDNWRSQYPEDYENAYIAMSIHEFLIPVIIPSLMHFDPLHLQEDAEQAVGDELHGRINSHVFFSSLTEMPWYQPLKEYCSNTRISRDSAILPRLIQKCVLSYVNDIILFDWNPLSRSEAVSLHALLSELAGFFTTVTDELRAVYSNISRRISDVMNSGLFCVCQLFSERSNSIQTEAQEIVEIYITRGIRILEVITILASYMELGTPAPFIDCMVVRLCEMLRGMASAPCLVPKCKQIALAINEYIPDLVENAKRLIISFILFVCFELHD